MFHCPIGHLTLHLWRPSTDWTLGMRLHLGMTREHWCCCSKYQLHNLHHHQLYHQDPPYLHNHQGTLVGYDLW